MCPTNNMDRVPANLALRPEFAQAAQLQIAERLEEIDQAMLAFKDGEGDMSLETILDITKTFVDMQRILKDAREKLLKDKKQLGLFLEGKPNNLSLTGPSGEASSSGTRSGEASSSGTQ